jgi:uncharacterized protein (DUF433 family)
MPWDLPSARIREAARLAMDWSQCPDVERTADTLSGAWRIKGTRIPVQAIIDNAEDCTPEEIAGPDI